MLPYELSREYSDRRVHLFIGLSFKTQALYVTVFLTRYLDLFYDFVSVYNTLMKIFFISSSCYVLYLMKEQYRCVPPIASAARPA